MKKTIMALLALGGIASGADNVTLRYSLTSFSSGYPLNTAANGGTTDVDHHGYVNWSNVEDISGTTKAVANLVGNGHFSIGGTDANYGGINAGGSNVLNTTDGFTLVFNGYAVDAWADFLSFTVGSTQYKFETDAANGVWIYTPTGSEHAVDGVASVSNVSREKWYNFALTASVGGYTLSVWDENGEKLSSSTFTGATGNLNYLYEGSGFEQHWKGGHLDNIGLYDGVLTDDNLASLVRSEASGNGMIQSFAVIPEPATATLSLLALAGLAARRRRR